MNVLKDEDVFKVKGDGITLLVIHVPRAEFNMRPVYVGENPYKGTFKRNHEGNSKELGRGNGKYCNTQDRRNGSSNRGIC